MTVDEFLDGEVRELLISGFIAKDLPQLLVGHNHLLIVRLLQTHLLNVVVDELGDLNSRDLGAVLASHELAHLLANVGGQRKSARLSLLLGLVQDLLLLLGLRLDGMGEASRVLFERSQ